MGIGAALIIIIITIVITTTTITTVIITMAIGAALKAEDARAINSAFPASTHASDHRNGQVGLSNISVFGGGARNVGSS